MPAPIPRSFIDDLLAQCDIVALINQFVPLRKQGANYTSCCPFHEESTPSFTVSATKQIYHCFGCNAGGNAISFAMRYQKKEFVEAIEWLADYLQITMPVREKARAFSSNTLQDLYAVLEQAALFYHTHLKNTPLALNYLEKRGITQQSIEQFKIGFAPSGWSNVGKFLIQEKKYSMKSVATAGLIIAKSVSQHYDRFRSRIIFPIRDKQGRYIGFGGRVLDTEAQPKYLNSPETPVFIKNRELYGLYETYQVRNKPEHIWVVEGYLDVVAFNQFGVQPVVATLGTATSRVHLQQLFRLTESVIFCFDGDIAGKKAAVRAMEMSLVHIQDHWTIRFLLLPENEDPDSWIRQSKTHQQETLVKQTIALEDFLFQYIQKDVASHTLEGKRKMLQKAIPLFKKIPQGIRREQLFQRLARLVDMQANQLQNLDTKHYALKDNNAIKKYSVTDRAIGLLLQHPQLLSPTLPETLSTRIASTSPLLQHLIALVRTQPDIRTSAVLEKFRNKPLLSQHLMALTQHNWLIPPEGVIAEFQDILVYLDKWSRNQHIQQLLQKARETSLTTTEKHQLTQLLGEHN